MFDNSNYNSRRKLSPVVPTDSTGKLPPRDVDLEQAVLGAIMLESDAYSQVSELLTPESFYEPAHQKIYDAIVRLALNQKPIDMLTVTDQLQQDGTLESVGGRVFIAELTTRVMSAANVEFHARIVAQKHLARRLITFATKVEEKAFDEGNDVADLLQEAEGALFEISQTQLKREVTHIDSVLSEAMRQIQAASNRSSGLSGLPSGYPDLDHITSGWQNSDLIIVAARPAMGKTAFVLSMAKNMAVDYDIPIGFFSLEMSNVQLVKRLLSNVAEIDGIKLKSGQLDDADYAKLNTNMTRLNTAPIYLDETPGLSITELRTKARRLVREHGVKMIFIDYLQLMMATGMKFSSREQEVSTISRSLKALAKELNIPVLALAQLSRQNESRTDKHPMLSDLRESGAIEQDADIVCFIHRPAYYTKSKENAEGEDISDLAEFMLAKHRSGSTGDVKLRFVSQYAKFENWDEARQRVQSVVNAATIPSRFNSRSKSGENGIGSVAEAPHPEVHLSVADKYEQLTPMDPFMPGPDEAPYPF